MTTAGQFLSQRPLLPYERIRALTSFGDNRFNGREVKTLEEIGNGAESGDVDKTNYSKTPIARDGAPCRQHNLRNGTARRISATLRSFAALRGLGPRGSRSLAGRAPIHPNCPRAISRCQAMALTPGSIAGSGSSNGIEGGMSTGTRFLPATQASMMSDHSCIMWRRCTSYSALL